MSKTAFTLHIQTGDLKGKQTKERNENEMSVMNYISVIGGVI